MECHLELPELPKEERVFVTSAKTVLPQEVSQLNGSRMAKDSLVCAKRQNDVVRNVASSSSQQLESPLNQWIETSSSEERELVKYMSKLPGYLERSEAAQDKFWNVGVLNWGRLEKWQHKHKQMPEKSKLSAVSQMNALSSLPTDSSARPSRVQPQSSTYRRTDVVSTVDDGSQIVKSDDRCVKKHWERKTNWKNNFKDHGDFGIQGEQFYQKTSGVRSGHEKDLGIKICPENRTVANGLQQEVGSNIETKLKTCSSEHKRIEEKLKERSRNDHHEDAERKQQGKTELSHSTKKLPQKKVKARRRDSTEKTKEVYCGDIDSAVQHPLGFIDKVSQEVSQTMPLTTKVHASSSSCKNTGDKRSALLSVRLTDGEPAHDQDLKSNKSTSEKGRSISPFQRPSFSRGKTSKTNGEKDMNVGSGKSGKQATTASSGVNNSDCNKPSGKDIARTSPLRRLLEPLMKPKVTHSGDFQERSKGQRVQRGSDGKLYPSILQPGKVKFGITGCKTINVNDSAHEKKLGSTIVQALFRVTVKNNQPLFTFAVTKESDILAATLKKLGSLEEDECTSIYTFFSIQENKKNGVRINQRNKGQTRDIVSNVVAQMRVFSSLPSGSTREFVLFSVDLGQVNEEKSDLQPKNELAAIVINMPRKLNTDAYRNVVQPRNEHNGSGESGFEGHAGQDISATVILQSGVHSLPNKGGPSSLIQRWRSGGSCDCGGWDEGCNLRVLANQHRPSKNSTSSNALPSADRFELYLVGGGHHENQPFLSFVPFKDGIYSISYSSSLTLPQAFSICIAVAESRKLSETLERKVSYEEESSLIQSQETKHHGSTGEIPGGCV